MNSLLPPNSTAFERAMEQVCTSPLLGIQLHLKTLWNAKNAPSNVLPWLAWGLSVDSWGNWPDDIKRDLITASSDVHRHKGTIGAIRAFLTAAGFGDAEIIEGTAAKQYDGSSSYDGGITHELADQWVQYDGSLNHDGVIHYAQHGWAKYSIRLNQPVPVARVDELRASLEKIAPARCELVHMYYDEAHGHNHMIHYDGTYSYGTA